MLSAFLRTLFAWQRRRGRRLGIANGQTGSVTFLQRFGGALNLNPHAHVLVPDGLFVPNSSGRLGFAPLPPPTDEDVLLLTQKIARRLTAIAQRHIEEQDPEFVDADDEQAVLQHDLAESLKLPGFGRATASWLLPDKPLCASVDSFSLHAARTVAEEDREGLEKLCSYGLRSPFSQERLSLLPDGRVCYRLRRPWPTSNGANELVLDPIDFLRRLAALIPPPHMKMVRYHGVFANRSRYRSQLPPPPPPIQPPGEAPQPLFDRPLSGSEYSPAASPDKDVAIAGQQAQLSTPGPPASENGTSAPSPSRRPARIGWAALLRRVLHVDALRCARCSAQMVVLAFITDPSVTTDYRSSVHPRLLPLPSASRTSASSGSPRQRTAAVQRRSDG